jgi:hypothetical protein
VRVASAEPEVVTRAVERIADMWTVAGPRNLSGGNFVTRKHNLCLHCVRALGGSVVSAPLR